MHKLRAIIRHEYMTIVKQPSFWAIMIGIPVLVGGAIGLSTLANRSSDDRIEQLTKELKNVSIVDESKLVNEKVAAGSQLRLSPASEKEQLREKVQKGELDALIVYPKDLEKAKNYDVYVSSTDFTKTQSVSSLAETLLQTSGR